MKDYKPGRLAPVTVESTEADQSTRADQSTEDQPTLVFVRHFRHPVAAVWSAITEPEQLNEWAPFTADRDLAALGEATITMIDGDSREEMKVTVTVVEPPTRLEYIWGTDVLRWHLEPTDDGSRMTLRHTVQSREWLSQVAAGWHICLDVAELLLDGRPIGAIRGREAQQYGWSELNDAYAAAMQESADEPKG
jgi:uncharacterized protein YndB with AHSA1/START domain